ncbi:phosphotransferase [Acidimangrovimonas sediminis]|uniref:phosphotransferase n=1 Tax=Acidimangrovimonas sediminis TaxID=2056283 RepID=UPI000C80F4EF|nr:phosphotransferase [Acidimangrovimonas sediminis]
MQLDLSFERIALPAVREMIADHYGLTGEVTPLSAEKDQLFDLRADGPRTDGRRLLFRITHPTETDEEAALQIAVLEHLARVAPDIPVQRLVPTRAGAPMARIRDQGGAGRNLRLVTWLDGALFRHSRAGLVQAQALGAAWAGLSRSLEGFDHPGLQRQSPWNLREAGTTRAALSGLADADRRDALARLHDRLAPGLEAGFAALPLCPVHNDFSGDNILVDPQRPERLTGILDFGDLTASHRICDVAVAACDFLEGGEDPLARSAAFVAGFAEAQPLTEIERALVFDLILMRLFLRIAIAELRAAANPANHAYLTRNTARLRDRLAELEALDPGRAAARFHAAGDPTP